MALKSNETHWKKWVLAQSVNWIHKPNLIKIGMDLGLKALQRLVLVDVPINLLDKKNKHILEYIPLETFNSEQIEEKYLFLLKSGANPFFEEIKSKKNNRLSLFHQICYNSIKQMAFHKKFKNRQKQKKENKPYFSLSFYQSLTLDIKKEGLVQIANALYESLKYLDRGSLNVSLGGGDVVSFTKLDGEDLLTIFKEREEFIFQISQQIPSKYLDEFIQSNTWKNIFKITQKLEIEKEFKQNFLNDYLAMVEQKKLQENIPNQIAQKNIVKKRI